MGFHPTKVTEEGLSPPGNPATLPVVERWLLSCDLYNRVVRYLMEKFFFKLWPFLLETTELNSEKRGRSKYLQSLRKEMQILWDAR